jgi:tRNA nucleotidyltransferase (CCA-adding enzyme)
VDRLWRFGTNVMNVPQMIVDKLPVPPEVTAIATRLEKAGHETWCVGGAVRDYLLGFPNNDVDLATAATPQEVQRLFRRTVPVGESHGTVAVLDRENVAHEVTTFRRDVATDGRHAVVQFGVSLADDLARRDFTINAIAYHPLRGEWRDPHDGRGDIDRRIVRAVGDPDTRFREDFLRILRALRFSARFGFAIEDATWRAAKRCVSGVSGLSAERVRDEWFKGLLTAQSTTAFAALWRDIGAIEVWLPETMLASELGEHRLRSLDRFPDRDPVLLTSYLSDAPERTLLRLKAPTAAVKRAAGVGRFRSQFPDATSSGNVRRWLAEVGELADDLVVIAEVEGAGRSLREAVEAVRASGAALAVRDLAVDGRDLMAQGVPEGPRVGQILHQLLITVLENPELNRRETLLEMAKAHVSQS